MDVRPEIVAACDVNPAMVEWFGRYLPACTQLTSDYREVLANPDVDAVYIAVPHNLHAETYRAAIEAGKHLMGEKPFGIDLAANEAILACVRDHPDLFVRCSSESPFFAAPQRIGRMIEEEAFGRIIEVESGFLHSSDLDPDKPINWKRQLEFNGEYGCMGDLGLHACHLPFRAKWLPMKVSAFLSNIVSERPDGLGGMAPCGTWDNATLLCKAEDSGGHAFPLTLKMHRISPGNKNTWYLEILGTRGSARWSSKQVNALEVMEYNGGEQAWQAIEMGHQTAHRTITGDIFEMGFSDSILQMWAAFLHELEHGEPLSRFAGCVTPEETGYVHRLFTAALRSQAGGTTERV